MFESPPLQHHCTPHSLSAVVVSYRTGPVLAECVSTLRRQPEIAEILVVDNGNNAAEQSYLDQLSRQGIIRLIRNHRNLGFAAACNQAAERASSPYLALVNPDLTVPDGTIAAVLQAFDDHPDAWLCGGRLLNMDGQEQQGGRRDTLTPWRALVEALRLDRLFPHHPYFNRLNLTHLPPILHVEEVPAISGAFMVLPRHRYQQMGGLDAEMFLHIEDLDLCLRILKANGKILYCGTAPIHHHGSTSDASRIAVEWHKTRSTIYYFRKHFSPTYPDWALSATATMLWVRFACLCPRWLVRDGGWLMRHFGERLGR